MGNELMFEPAELERKPVTPMDLLQMAVAKEGSIDVIERLAKLQREEREYQATVDFDEALNRCQAKMKRVAADMTNPQTHSKYASYAALDRAIRPEYTSEGFSISYGEDVASTADYIVMLAYLSRAGHTRIFRKGMPIDTKGPKGNDVMTKTHAAGSGGSYAKRYLLKDIFNLAVGEDDDDGNGGEHVTQEAGADWVNRIEGAETAEGCMKIWTEAVASAKKLNDYKAMTIFTEARDARLKAIKKVGKQ